MTDRTYAQARSSRSGPSWQSRAAKYIRKNIFFFLLLLPGTILILVFYYLPDYGILMAFEDFNIGLGVFHSPFVGLQKFAEFFSSVYFLRTLKNTVVLSSLSLLFTFPAPIIFALMLNEVKNAAYKRTIQTISYLPHFISTVILCGLVFTFLNPANGILTQMIKDVTGKDVIMLGSSVWFRPIYVALGVYGSFGWDSIIYLAALSSIDPALYEAAKIDGASRWQQMRLITLPSISPSIVILLILAMGNLLNVGFETVYLLYSPAIYDVADVLQTYAYRVAVSSQPQDFSYGTVVVLFNSVASFALVWLTNLISRKVNDISLW